MKRFPLPVPAFGQTPSHCGPACLRMVLAYYGTEVSEREIARLAGTTDAAGTPGEAMVRAAKALGFGAKLKDSCTIDDLRAAVRENGIPPIVDWFCRTVGHYSVIVDVDKTHVHILDPQTTKTEHMPINAFLGVWFDFNGEVYPERKSDMILRRAIFIAPSA